MALRTVVAIVSRNRERHAFIRHDDGSQVFAVEASDIADGNFGRTDSQVLVQPNYRSRVMISVIPKMTTMKPRNSKQTFI